MWYAFNKTFEFYDCLIFFPFKWSPSRKQMQFAPTQLPLTWLSSSTILLTILCFIFNIWYLLSLNVPWNAFMYIQFLTSLIQLLFQAVLGTFAVYFIIHGGEMSALFSDSYRAMIGGKLFLAQI